MGSDDKGRFFSEADIFGWYLFLADAFLDHIWNYEPMYGSRVVPVLASVGRNLDLLRDVDGLEERVRRLVRGERRQPNGGLFELLVGAAYRRAGGKVAFLPEKPGKAKTHDMNVTLAAGPWRSSASGWRRVSMASASVRACANSGGRARPILRMRAQHAV